jgi:hypothetical protein
MFGNEKPLITRRCGRGEYSTVTLPNGVIETCWFGDDGESRVIGRTYPRTLANAAESHIREWEREEAAI